MPNEIFCIVLCQWEWIVRKWNTEQNPSSFLENMWETFHKFITNIFGKQTLDATAPTCNGDQNISQGGPNGDPILSEMVT